MKTAIKALLAAVGLAPAAHVDHLNTDLRRAEARIVHLEDQLVLVRADSENWKRRYEDASDGMAGWKQAANRAQGDADRAKATTEKARAELEALQADTERAQARAAEWRTRAETLEAELHGMRERLQDTHSVAASAHEQLMAMEVKLDLIETAIQVLDTRTREQAVARPV